MPWKNFSIWRGRLPHWRADEVVYYVTFRFRRPLGDRERTILMSRLMKLNSRGIDLLVAAVGVEAADLIFKVVPGKDGRPGEFSKAVEAVKQKSGKDIIKLSGERFPPFFGESYDRIIRDDSELAERYEAALALVDEAETDPGTSPFVYLADSPSPSLSE